MAIKRKTHLNLSGSHHTLDSDNAFVGGTLYITGALSASAGVTASIRYVDGASTPFIANGPNITANYNSLGQWEITGSGGGGGSTLWTELDASTIYTTSSVLVANLSASLGATVTGSFRLTGTFSQGAFTTVSGIEAHAHGYNVAVAGNYAHGEGVNVYATGNYSHAEGTGNITTGASAHAEGDNTLAEGDASHTEGQYTRTTTGGQWAHAEGYMTTGSAQHAHAEGNETVASGNSSHAEGRGTQAQSYASHAEGLFTIAANDGAHAEGYSTYASGYASHAEGLTTQATGQYSHAEGWASQAQGDYSHAEGSASFAYGIASHAQGWQTATYGSGSFAAGLNTIANGPVDGGAPSTTQAVFGKYNISDSTSLFVIGDGTNLANRHDALRLVSGSQGTMTQVTGSLQVSGPLSSSGALTTQGNLRVQGNTQLTGAVYLGSTLSASGQISTAGDLLVQGISQFTGSLYADGLGSFQTLSGSNPNTFLGNFGAASTLVVESSTVVTNSLMAFDGVDPDIGAGGLLLQNGAGFFISSGSFTGNNVIFAVNRAQNAGTGNIEATASTFKINGFDIVPLWNHATTSFAAPSTLLSGSLLTDNMPAAGIGLFDLNVIAVDDNQSNYASWTTIVTMTSSNAGGVSVAGITEIDNILVGSDAAGWDLNIVGSGIEVTGSISNPPFTKKVYWMAKLTQKMILSGSGQVMY